MEIATPTSSTKDSPTRLRAAVSAAGRFLLENQSADGTWRDFMTQPGISDAWTSGYVGSCLMALPEDLRPPGTQQAIHRAATWLAQSINRFHGWAYNSVCPTDADSTANVVLFLDAAEWEFPPHAYARLLSFQREDGGFRTYYREDPADSWGLSHTCVTPVVVRALLPVKSPDDVKMARAFEAILAAQREDGLWPSFWWGTHLYSTMVNLEVCLDAGVEFPRGALLTSLGAAQPASAFDRALLLRCFTLLGVENASLKEELQATQNSDGSWESMPMLRVTHHESHEPWSDDDPGPLFADQNRLLTTATAMRSLALAGIGGDIEAP